MDGGDTRATKTGKNEEKEQKGAETRKGETMAAHPGPALPCAPQACSVPERVGSASWLWEPTPRGARKVHLSRWSWCHPRKRWGTHSSAPVCKAHPFHMCFVSIQTHLHSVMNFSGLSRKAPHLKQVSGPFCQPTESPIEPEFMNFVLSLPE